MSTSSFEKNSLGWQLYQLQQRIGEWWELQTSRFVPNLPNTSSPSWLKSPLLWTIAKVAFWLVLAFLLSWAALQIMRRLSPYFYGWRNQLHKSTDKARTPNSEASVTSWLQRSQKFQQQGNYREACLCLYMAMLQRLNDTGIAKDQASRTDGEYLQLVQQLPQPQPYQTLLMTHQELCFSNTEASRSLFDECQQAYREIEAS
ncbi:MAG TPA: DUF4129 domain-containing protein [Candidatus Sericytochromatia bacterium]|jgi:hypothetical protein